jgi:hypothetical protein
MTTEIEKVGYLALKEVEALLPASVGASAATPIVEEALKKIESMSPNLVNEFDHEIKVVEANAQRILNAQVTEVGKVEAKAKKVVEKIEATVESEIKKVVPAKKAADAAPQPDAK